MSFHSNRIENIREYTFGVIKEQKSHWKLFFWMLLYALIPAIWILVRAVVITKYMSADVQTYAQWDYLNIMLEVVQETAVFPLFWWFGKIMVNRKKDLDKVREVYLITFIIYLLLITLLSFFVGDLVKIIGSDEGVSQKTFFTFQLWSKVPAILTAVSTVILLNLKKYKAFLILLFAKLSLALTFDFTLANNQIFANAYIGLGISTFLTELILFFVSLLVVAEAFGFKRFFNWKTFNFRINDWNFNRAFWLNVLASFLFSTINNTFYLFMMGRNMNIANGSDAYWLANTIIWSWILMLSNVVFAINKSIVATEANLCIKKRTILILEFQIITLFSIILSFLIFIPVYKQFALFLSNEDFELVERSWSIFSKLIWFFVFYVSSASLNAHFNGEGKNWILMVQALISNVLTFVPFIILHSIGELNYTVDVLALMFGFSLLVSWIISICFVVAYLLINQQSKSCLNFASY